MDNNWANNSHLTWKARLFVAAAAAAAAAVASVSIGFVAAVNINISRAPTTAAAAATATATTFVVVLPRPQIIIPSSPSIASLEIQARERRRNRKCRHGRSILFPCDESHSSSVLLNYSGRKFDDDSNNNNRRKPSHLDLAPVPPITSTNEQNNDIDNKYAIPPLSEPDALRILRRPSSSSSSSSPSCRTPRDVLHILRRASNTNNIGNSAWHKDGKSKVGTQIPTEFVADYAGSYSNYSSIMVDRIMGGITSSIAAAALRRLCSPPFLHVPLSSPSKSSSYSNVGGRYRWGIHSASHIGMSSTESGITTTKLESTSEDETNTYERMMSHLLKHMNVTMQSLLFENQPNAWVKGGSASIWVTPVLLPRRDDGNTIDVSRRENASSILDSSALTDLIHALSNLASFLVSGSGGRVEGGGRYHGRDTEGGGGGMIEGNLLTNISPNQQESIMDLFDSVIEHISRDNVSLSNFVRSVGPKRLVLDVVLPCAKMTIARWKMMRMSDDDYEEGIGGGWIRNDGRRNAALHNMNRLLATVSSYLALPHSLEQLTATDISDTLFSLTTLDNYVPQCMVGYTKNDDASTFHHRHQTMHQRKMLRAFMKRLRKYPIRSAASGKELARAMWSAARLIRRWEEQEEHLQQSDILSTSSLHVGRGLVEDGLLSLPVCLPGEEESEHDEGVRLDFSSSSKDIDVEVDQSQFNNTSLNDISASLLREEAIIMFHTLVNEIVHPPNFPRHNSNINGHTTPPTSKKGGTKLHTLEFGQIADILQAATDLHISGEDMSLALVPILKHLTVSLDPSARNNHVLSQCRSCRDISRVLFSMQRLRVGTGIFDNAAIIDDSVGDGFSANGDNVAVDAESSDGLESRSVRVLGEKFRDIVNWHKQNRSTPACDGKTLSIILRSGVLMFRETNNATSAMLDAASILILDEGYEFLSSCNEFEVSSFLLAYAMARRFNQEIFASLTDQMAEDDILESCTPSSASRAMWSCAMLLSQDENGSGRRTAGTAMNTYKLIDLFHQLAPLLLTSSLSPTSISGAMWAMAKSGYVVDRGVFDYLAQTFSSEGMLLRSNTRVVSQALWSCAKMVEFESPKVQHDSDSSTGIADGNIDIPPYVSACYKYVLFLVENRDRISSKQLSRSIWAIGRLGLERLRLLDNSLIRELGDMAMFRSSTFDSNDIANVIWGLSKVNYDNPVAILRLAQQITSPTSLEASMMLFALGKLQIYDKEVFKSLYASISSSPQSSVARFSSYSFLIW